MKDLILEELNRVTINPTNYSEALLLSLACAEYCKNDSDVWFNKSLPKEVDEYLKLPHAKDRFIHICL